MAMTFPIVWGIVSLIAGYLLGSIPTAYVVARVRKGIDIRNVDVGNVGAGAIFRQVGLIEGMIVAFVDIGKGAAAVLIAQAFNLAVPWVFGAGFAAVLGHCFPVWIKFRGGQGVATVIGVFLVLAPLATLVVLALVGLALLLIRHLFVSIFVAGPFLPVLVWLFYQRLDLLIFAIVTVVFVVLKTVTRWKEVPEKVGEKNKPGLMATIKSLLKR